MLRLTSVVLLLCVSRVNITVQKGWVTSDTALVTWNTAYFCFMAIGLNYCHFIVRLYQLLSPSF